MTPTRTRTRAAAQQRRAATEQAILDATEALLETRPYRELTVEDVMEAAGLSRTAFYRYFPDLETVVLRHMAGIADEIALASYHWLTAEDPDAQLVDAACASRPSTGSMVASCRHSPMRPGPGPTYTRRGERRSTG